MTPANLFQIIIILVGTSVIFLIMFLPSIIELRKPKDSGPRMIMDELPDFLVRNHHVAVIPNIEEEQELEYCLIPQLTKIVQVLPSLEA